MRKRPTQDDGQRVHDIGDDPPPTATTKWASWLSAIAIAALLGASIFAFAPYLRRCSSGSSSRSSARRSLQNETTDRFLMRGAIGGLTGAVVGCGILVRVSRRNENGD